MSQHQHDPFLSDREFSRVDTRVPFEFRLVPQEERINIRCTVSTEPSVIGGPLPELDDNDLSVWLQTINSKLDTILNYIMFQKEGFLSLKMRPVNISGGGMSFTSDRDFKLEDILEVKMMLHAFQPVALYLYGRVVKAEPAGDDRNFNIAIQFIEIDDDITNTIVRYVFEVQRGQLRKRKE
jgi:hypothetical protein